MRNLAFTFIILLFISCEDVIDVDLPETEIRLVIDAIIRVDESQEFTTARVKVALTSSFFETNPVTQLSDINIINLDAPTLNDANVILLTETEPNTGIYEGIKNTDFFTEGELILQLEHENRRYFARTTYSPTTQIDELVQGTETLFDEDDTEVKVTFTDNPEMTNYYVFDFGFGEFQVVDDQFFQGEQFQFSYFYQTTLNPGDEINVSILGADLDFHNYMNLLIEQTEDDGGIFDTPVATARGNIFDITDLDNITVVDNVSQPDLFPLGYFAVVQEFTQSLTIE
ncbi:DUF4249 family protein [Flagellimonas meridianipacifica]|uniref:Uncharacterized protein DUF4249 n=1 Tax=Flagellimonas meridianipacifica TaxID=1080225 RepID=A0A2T0MAN4_9FLAO|nr:DUF4249 family protein [Allomuricauda pacifica]PRX54472.1 uncharacterized protein DUF4249 [Allomuricauda pacifica]